MPVWCNFAPRLEVMKTRKSLLRFGSTLGISLSLGVFSCFIGCATKPGQEVPASMAVRYGSVQDQGKVEVRVSLSNRAVYVYEGDEPRFVAAVSVGKPSNPTPTGTFKVQHKEAHKRSSLYGFAVNGSEVRPVKRSALPPGYKYVGYPLPYWVYFGKDCGFHAGAVWPEARTHGCVRLHKTVAKEFYDLVRVGTPVKIANSWPEDATIGKNVPRPTDYDHPDSPPSVRASDAVFHDIENVWF